MLVIDARGVQCMWHVRGSYHLYLSESVLFLEFASLLLVVFLAQRVQRVTRVLQLGQLVLQVLVVR